MNGTKIEDQVYICFDGTDGLVIQTDRRSFERYYQLLGWELLGQAEPLPLFRQRQGVPVAAKRRIGTGYTGY